MSKILLDTNVLIYSIDQDSAFYTPARTILDSDHELYTTCKNISEFLAVITRAPVISLSMEEALTVVDDFIKVLIVLYPDDLSFTIFQKLLRQYQPTGLRIHDVEIASIGLAHHINQIATFNKKDFEGIQEINLFEL